MSLSGCCFAFQNKRQKGANPNSNFFLSSTVFKYLTQKRRVHWYRKLPCLTQRKKSDLITLVVSCHTNRNVWHRHPLPDSFSLQKTYWIAYNLFKFPSDSITILGFYCPVAALTIFLGYLFGFRLVTKGVTATRCLKNGKRKILY